MIKISTLKRTIQVVVVYANHPAKAVCYSYLPDYVIQAGRNFQHYEQKLLSRIIAWLTITIRLVTELEFLIKESDEFVAIFTSALKTLNKSLPKASLRENHKS